ncbi:MAG: hypothetical protein FJZ00_13870 [Candidatus Sericytochromatia bacterium]|uniref:Uncharacterized protein n=1 Tax=Candidatus Tanganyikabacteria bacterium TaxID=2961651 RepID=A0A937X537_9BACT|nr:hypothetical protein [Candidatus Tanganyikabacteria bacterium]
MPWVKYDDQFPEHPKLASFGCLAPLVRDMHVCMTTWCSRYLTDGRIAKGVVERICAMTGIFVRGDDGQPTQVDHMAVAARMVREGLLEDHGDHYLIHDYLEYNPSKEHVLAERKAAKERMQKMRSEKPAKFSTRSPEHPANFAQGSTTPVPDPVPDPVSPIPGDPPSSPPAAAGGGDGEIPIEVVTSSPVLPTGSRSPLIHPGFEEFWLAYPRRCSRRNRAEAMKSWNRAKPNLPIVLDALAWQDREFPDWQKEGGAFIEAPSVWLNNKRWERERPVTRYNAGPIDPHAKGTVDDVSNAISILKAMEAQAG